MSFLEGEEYKILLKVLTYHKGNEVPAVGFGALKTSIFIFMPLACQTT